VAPRLSDDHATGSALRRAMRVRQPGRAWRIGALWPEELAGVFSGAGFARTSLTQWQMAKTMEGS